MFTEKFFKRLCTIDKKTTTWIQAQLKNKKLKKIQLLRRVVREGIGLFFVRVSSTPDWAKFVSISKIIVSVELEQMCFIS